MIAGGLGVVLLYEGECPDHKVWEYKSLTFLTVFEDNLHLQKYTRNN